MQFDSILPCIFSLSWLKVLFNSGPAQFRAVQTIKSLSITNTGTRIIFRVWLNFDANLTIGELQPVFFASSPSEFCSLWIELSVVICLLSCKVLLMVNPIQAGSRLCPPPPTCFCLAVLKRVAVG